MADWRSLLKERAILVADGAWGTELAARGLPPGAAPELWNVDQPDAVAAVAKSYVDAGADIILTNTFGGTAIRLAHAGLAERMEELNRRGAAISRAAAGDDVLVFGSVGPTGEMMAPMGLKSEDEFATSFRGQIAALVAGGVDAILIETMMDLGEARAALTAARDVCDLPVVVSMTYDIGPGGAATMMGVRPAQQAELDADILGANCGTGMADLTQVARLLRESTDKPLWVKPNAGRPEMVDGETVYRETADTMAAQVPDLVDAGANLIGGCCGTTPAHIRTLCATVEGLRDRARAVSSDVLARL